MPVEDKLAESPTVKYSTNKLEHDLAWLGITRDSESPHSHRFVVDIIRCVSAVLVISYLLSIVKDY